jgi:hypothetical protein
MQVKTMMPIFRAMGSGDRMVDRPGALLLQFAKSIHSQRYDWLNKISFRLSVTEMSQVFLGSLEGDGTECHHTPRYHGQHATVCFFSVTPFFHQ